MSFIDFSWWPIFIPLIAGLLRKQYFDKAFKIFFAFVFYAVLNECVVFFLRHTFSIKNTMPYINLYLVLSFSFITYFYSIILAGIINRKRFLWFVSIAAFYFIFHILFFKGIFIYPSLLGSVKSLIYITLSLVYFYNFRFDFNEKKVWDNPLLWINLGILIHNSGALFNMILFNLILEYSREFSKLTLVYYSALNALFYILIAIGFWKTKKNIPEMVTS